MSVVSGLRNYFLPFSVHAQLVIDKLAYQLFFSENKVNSFYKQAGCDLRFFSESENKL
jgi:hypothetical protein